MRIALFNTYDTRGGAARAAYRLHQGLRQLGHDSAMLTRFKRSADPDIHQIEPATSDAKALYIPAMAKVHERLIQSNRTPISNTHFSLPYPGFDLTRHPLVRQADVLNLHWTSSMLSPEGIAKLHELRKPLVWTLHDQRPLTGGCHFSAGCTGYERSCSTCPQLEETSFPLTEKLHNHATRWLPVRDITLVSPSRWLAGCASRSALFRHSRITHIPYGLDLDRFHTGDKMAARKKLGLPHNALCLLFGADTFREKRKGIRQLLAALAVCLEHPRFKAAVAERHLCLFCFGSLPVDHSIPGLPVTALGHVDCDELLACAFVAADLFLFCSSEDNLPNTILESMACGTPVLATAVGGVPELVDPGRTGLLVPREDIGGYASALVSMLADRKRLETWGRNARESVEQRHSLNAQARRYQTLFEQLLESSARAASPAHAKRSPAVKNANRTHFAPTVALPRSAAVLPLAQSDSIPGVPLPCSEPENSGPSYDGNASTAATSMASSAAGTAGATANFSAEPLPIGVVIPTLNVRDSLPDHLASVQSWAHLVQEITVVDSYSRDGTVEFLRSELRHRNIRILQCPPGLYAAWNLAIEGNTSEFTYISTIGDTITADGLKHLVDTARNLKADIIISPPTLMEADGRRLTDKQWPVHEFIEACAIQRPVRLPQPLAFLLATLYIPESILGSSASNLYRTQILRQFPFPTDFGHIGDTAWGVRHALKTSIAITPESFSRFLFHRPHVWASEAEKETVLRRLLDLARQAIGEMPGPLVGEGFLNAGRLSSIISVAQGLPDEIQLLHEAQRRYDRARREHRPWIFSPAAWRARSQRNRQRNRLSQAQANFWHLLQADAQML